MKNFYQTIVTFFIVLACLKLAQAQTSPNIYTIINSSPGGGAGKILVINPLNFQVLHEIPLSNAADKVEVTKDKEFAFATEFATRIGKGLSVINLNTKTLKTKIFPDSSIPTIKIAPNGLLWIILQNESKVVLLDPNSLEIKHSLIGINDAQDIIFNQTHAYVSLNSSIMVFDTTNASPKFLTNVTKLPSARFQFSASGELAISPNEKLLCLARNSTITLIDTSTFKVTQTFTVTNNGSSGLLNAHFVNEKLLYISEINGAAIYNLDIETGQIKKIFNTRLGNIQNTKLSANKKLLYVSHFLRNSIIDTERGEVLLAETDLCGTCFSLGIALTGDFSIGQPPTIQTTAPGTNQQVMAGQATTIKWQTTVAEQSYAIASHRVEISTDSGATFAPIPGAERLPADAQEFTWQVPDIELLNKVQIRVSTVDLGAKRANSTTGNFSIVKGSGQTGDTQAPMVSFLSPKGGERFTSGDNLQISWMSSDNVGVTSQDLSLSTDGGNTFPITLANGLVGTTQSFSFPIPMTLQSEQTRLRLVVRDLAGNSSQALTPSNFRIELGADTTLPVVTISEPTANQGLIAGQPIQVRWQSTDNRAVVNQALLLSLDRGQTFTTLSSFGASDNSFVINNIDSLTMSNAQVVVRITATDASGNVGQANAQFSLSPAITSATYQTKTLNLTGIGFMSSSSTSTIRLFVNEKEITLTPTTFSNNSFSIKANKKKLGIVRGNNTVRLVVDGVESNTVMFNF